MTELREKMIRKMELRDLSKNTQRSYLQSVFILFFIFASSALFSGPEIHKQASQDKHKLQCHHY